jgi:hypothetical protein
MPVTRLIKTTSSIIKNIRKKPERFDMWCWRRLEKISWIERVGYKELLHTAKEERNTLHGINRRKAKWLGDVFHRNCLLKHVIEGQKRREDDEENVSSY